MNIDNNVVKKVGELLVFFKFVYKEIFDFDGFFVYDVLIVVYCVVSELFMFKEVNIVVEICGEYMVGMILVDLLGVIGRKFNVKFGLIFDVDGFWDLMIKVFKIYLVL